MELCLLLVLMLASRVKSSLEALFFFKRACRFLTARACTCFYRAVRSDNFGCFPFTKKFRKFRLGCKWNTRFWFVPLENFRNKRNF